jgi:hypothetical protein
VIASDDSLKQPVVLVCRCGHSYQPHYELPYGNTVTGSAWSKDFPDPGSYNGTEELLKIDVQVSVTGGT